MMAALRKIATSLLLIVLVAFVARLTFACYQTRQIPAQVLRTVPFQTETGHIAYSVASGKGFSSPYERDSGPTAILPPVYPLLVAALFKIFGVYSIGAYFAAIFLNIIFSTAACVPIYYAAKRIAGAGVASLATWFWALFITAIRMPTEWIWDTSFSALLVATDRLGHAGVAHLASLARLVRLRPLVGTRSDDQPRPSFRFPISGGVDYLPCQQSQQRKLSTTAPNIRICQAIFGYRGRFALLRPLDRTQLRRLPSLHSAALRPPLRVVHRQQRKLRRAPQRPATHHHVRKGSSALPENRRTVFHGRRKAQSFRLHRHSPARRINSLHQTLRSFLDRHRATNSSLS